jgi:hypothetical protein
MWPPSAALNGLQEFQPFSSGAKLWLAKVVFIRHPPEDIFSSQQDVFILKGYIAAHGEMRGN